jgi:hypothetical protein
MKGSVQNVSLTSMFLMTGWITVQQDVMVDFNLEKYPLEIKVEKAQRSNDVISLVFHDSSKAGAGGIRLRSLSTNPEYWTYSCDKAYSALQNTLPSTDSMIFKITLTRSYSGARLQIQCNDAQILSLLISISTCADKTSSVVWNKKVAKIRFSTFDTASDYYKVAPG